MNQTMVRATPLTIGSEIAITNIFKWLMVVSGLMFLGGVVTLPACYRRAKSTEWSTTDGVIGSTGLKTYSHKSRGVGKGVLGIDHSSGDVHVARVARQISPLEV